MSESSKKEANLKREQLIEKSLLAREMRELNPALEESTINEIVIEYFYSDDENIEFNTFKQWKAQGAIIKKGSESFPVWGQPLKLDKKEVDTSKMSEEEKEKAKYKYWPICHLFSNNQVRWPEEEKAQDEAEKATTKEIKEPIGEIVLDELL
ncbi:hypothetical protein [Roseivirga seohaensis]|uniref:hypothetical protein n=1 Tax=Roseivirga seohaensis TaxID=1914963 RepID=UPI003BA8EE40